MMWVRMMLNITTIMAMMTITRREIKKKIKCSWICNRPPPPPPPPQIYLFKKNVNNMAQP